MCDDSCNGIPVGRSPFGLEMDVPIDPVVAISVAMPGVPRVATERRCRERSCHTEMDSPDRRVLADESADCENRRSQSAMNLVVSNSCCG